jgi:hypothetical protein
MENGAKNQFAVDSFAKLRNIGLFPNIPQFKSTVSFNVCYFIRNFSFAHRSECNQVEAEYQSDTLSLQYTRPPVHPQPAEQRPRNVAIMTTVLHDCCDALRLLQGGGGEYKKPLTQLGVRDPPENSSQLVYLESSVPSASPQQVET